MMISPSTHLDIVSRINRALRQEGVSYIRVDRIRQATNGRLGLGTTTPLSTAHTLLKYRDLVLKAARPVNSNIID